MDTSRFYIRFRWWHSLLIVLVLILAFLLWASTWDFTPKVKPKLIPNPSLEITNDAWIGYYVEPFVVTFKSGNEILLTLESKETQFVKARQATDLPLDVTFGIVKNPKFLSLGTLKIESEVTATRWGLERTIQVNRDMTIIQLIGEAFKIPL